MRVTWDDVASRKYSQGVSQGVLYPGISPGVAWNGLVSVTETGEQDQDARYFDGQKFSSRAIPGVFAGTIEAFTYPDEFEACVGNTGIFTAQNRQPFGFSYRTNNEIHIVYNALAKPSKINRVSIGEKADPVNFQWDFTTSPEKIPGGKPSGHLVVLLDLAQPSAVSDLENLIYGTDTDDPVLPEPADIIAIFEGYTTVRVTDNGDGSFTVSGPDSAVTPEVGNTFQIIWPSVILIPDDMTLQTWDFESGVAGWYFWGGGTAVGTVTQSTDWARHGTHSGLITVTTQGTGVNEGAVDIHTPVAGDILEIKFTIYAPEDIVGASFGVDWKTSGGTYISTEIAVSSFDLAAGSFRTFTYQVGPAPAGTGMASFLFGFAPASPAGTSMAIDDVSYSIRKYHYQVSSL